MQIVEAPPAEARRLPKRMRARGHWHRRGAGGCGNLKLYLPYAHVSLERLFASPFSSPPPRRARRPLPLLSQAFIRRMYAPICTRDLALIYLFTRLAGERAGKLTENYTRALPPLVVARRSSVRISIGNTSIVGTRGVDGRYKARFEDSGVFLFEG